MSSVGKQPVEPTITIPQSAQGVTGLGQGGWTSARFVEAAGEPLRLSLRAPIPLDHPLSVQPVEGGWDLVDDHPQGGSDDPVVIMQGRQPARDFGTVEPVSVELAREARSRFDRTPETHQAPNCFSCGIAPGSMNVHPAELLDGSGRFASDWRPPARVGDDAGIVTNMTLWASLDCAAGFYVSGNALTDHGRSALTVQYEVEMLHPVPVEQDLVIMSWHGRWPARWDGTKRGAGSCVFDAEGTMLARSDSFWVVPKARPS